MESSNEIILSKTILENIFSFHRIFNKYLTEREPPTGIFFPTSDDLLPMIPQNIKDRFNLLIKDVSDKLELLYRSQQFQKVYREHREHYKENEDILDWTFGKNGIEQLLPISVYIFIKKCNLKCDTFHDTLVLFDNLCRLSFSCKCSNNIVS